MYMEFELEILLVWLFSNETLPVAKVLRRNEDKIVGQVLDFVYP